MTPSQKQRLDKIREDWKPGARLTTWGPKDAARSINFLLALLDQAQRDTERVACGLNLQVLRDKNIERQAVWCPDVKPDLSFRGVELAGETGEACNIIKKLERERHGWRGSKATKEELEEELADVVIVADLISSEAGIDLSRAVANKFNATSNKVNINVFIDLALDQAALARGEVK